jgi:hypothetical protein
MIPLEPIERDDRFQQESFVIECRSIAGFSGSPVFIHRRRDELPDIAFPKPGPAADYRQWLLGIDWCHLPADFLQVYEMTPDELKETSYRALSNSGFAGVIPAWRLRALLDSDELKQRRERDESAMTTKKAKSGGN